MSLLSALFGAVLGAGSNVFLDFFRRINDGRALAAMLAAEISATLDIVKKRNYESVLNGLREQYKAGHDAPFLDVVGDTAMWESAFISP